VLVSTTIQPIAVHTTQDHLQLLLRILEVHKRKWFRLHLSKHHFGATARQVFNLNRKSSVPNTNGGSESINNNNLTVRNELSLDQLCLRLLLPRTFGKLLFRVFFLLLFSLFCSGDIIVKCEKFTSKSCVQLVSSSSTTVTSCTQLEKITVIWNNEEYKERCCVVQSAVPLQS
jgi:hypothetical protein